MSIAGEREAQLDILRSAIVGVALKLLDAQSKAAVPLDRASQRVGLTLGHRAAIADVEHEGLDVTLQADGAVHLRFDVVIEQLGDASRSGSIEDRRAARRDAEARRIEHAVGIAEGRSLQHLAPESQVGRAEARRASVAPSAEVQRAVFRPRRGSFVIVGASEDAALPEPAAAAGMSGQRAVAGSGLEL